MRLIAIMMMLTMVMNLWRELSQPFCSMLEIVMAMSVEMASCRNLRKMLKALLLDWLISTYMIINTIIYPKIYAKA